MDEPSRTLEDGSPRRVRSLARIVWDRRAVHQFAPEVVPDEDVQTILALATQAPPGYGFQPWQFVVVRSAKQRQRLQRAAQVQAGILDASVVIVAFARKGAWFDGAAEVDGCHGDNLVPERKTRNSILERVGRWPIEVWLNRHVMVAFTYLMLAAESMNWDTVPMEDFDPEAVRRILGLPDDSLVISMLAVGRWREPDPLPSRRLEVEKLAHADFYGVPWTVPVSTTSFA